MGRGVQELSLFTVGAQLKKPARDFAGNVVVHLQRCQMRWRHSPWNGEGCSFAETYLPKAIASKGASAYGDCRSATAVS